MLGTFKKRNDQVVWDKDNSPLPKPLQCAIKSMLSWQRKWADFMQRQSEKLSRTGKLAIFFPLVLMCGVFCSHLLWTGTMVKIDGGSNKIPVAPNEQSLRPLKNLSDEEVILIGKLRYIRKHLDTTTFSGRRMYEQMQIQRPGLLDTIQLLEQRLRIGSE